MILNFLKKILFFISLVFSLSLFANEKIKNDINFFGFIQYDNVYWIGDKTDDFVSGIFFKDLSFCIKGFDDINDNLLSYFVKFDLSNYKSTNNLSEVYVNFNYDILGIKFGQIIPILSLEEAIEIKNKVFMENALLKSNFDESFLGLSINSNIKRYNFVVSFLTPDLLYSINKKIKKNNYSLSSRIYKLIDYKNIIMHLGINYSVFNRCDEEDISLNTSSFKDIPSFLSPYALLRTQPSCLPRYQIIGLEFLNIYKSFSFQSELRYTHAIWKDFDSEVYKSYYIQLSYFLNGGKRTYDAINGLTFNEISNSKFGSFEIAFRYNYVNITNEGPLLRGVSQCDGEKKSYNLGINWFINNKVRLQLNYANEKFSYRMFNDRSVSAIGLRTQFEF